MTEGTVAQETTKEGWENYEIALGSNIKTLTTMMREKWIGYLPFCVDNNDAKFVVNYGMKNKKLRTPEEMTDDDFRIALCPSVIKVTNELRTRSQTSMKTQWESKWDMTNLMCD